jgi:hypothetical protein
MMRNKRYSLFYFLFFAVLRIENYDLSPFFDVPDPEFKVISGLKVYSKICFIYIGMVFKM